MLHFQIDVRSGLPVYRQLMEQVRYYVASGVLREGERLPSIRELARALAVNPATVVKAYGELEHGGVVELRQGSGAFVATGAARAGEWTAERRAERLRELARQWVVEARQMGAGDGEVLERLREVLAEMGEFPTEGTGDDDKP